MQKWEYKWEYKEVGTRSSEAELNKLGQDGWELVAVAYDQYGSRHFYFKRRKIEQPKYEPGPMA